MDFKHLRNFYTTITIPVVFFDILDKSNIVLIYELQIRTGEI